MAKSAKPKFFLGAAVALVVALSGAAPARAEGGNMGLGLELGAPTGISFKYYLGANRKGVVTALQAGLGVIERVGEDGLHLHAEFLWHPAVLTRTADFSLPFYLGVGARLLEHNDDYCVRQGNEVVCFDDRYNDDTHLGVRAPFGVLMDFNNVPLDVFLELALTVDLLHLDDDDEAYEHDHDTVDLGAALGVRYYF